MSWTTRFDPAASRGILAADGPIDLGGSVEALLAMAADPVLGPGWGILVDLSKASYAPSLADAAKLVGLQQHADLLAGRKVAFLTATPSLQAVASLVAAMASAKGIPSKAFTDDAEADRWLRDEAGLSVPPPLRPSA